jgi:hypothetical protein
MEESRKENLETQSAVLVFSQPLAMEDSIKKKSYFLEQAQLYFRGVPTTQDGAEVVISIENHDMAALTWSMPANLKTENVGFKPLEERRTDEMRKPSNSNQQSPVKQKEGSRNDSLKRGASPLLDEDRVVIRSFKNGAKQLRINHKSASYLITIAESACQNRIWTSTKKLIRLFNFTSVESPALENPDSSETNSDCKTLNERKISIGCNCADGSAIEKCCLSSTSTQDASDQGIQGSHSTEVLCNIEGEIALYQETPKYNTAGSPTLSMNLFVLAKDQATKSFIRTLPEIRHIAKHAFLQLVENSMEEGDRD